MDSDQPDVEALLAEVKALAQRYRALMGRSLGVTGEIAEYEAVRLLDLKIASAGQAGYDAVEETTAGTYRYLQIKGKRCDAKNLSGQKIGRLNDRHDWHAVLMVLLDQSYNATGIWELTRDAALSVRKFEKGISVRKFIELGVQRWPRSGTT